ncbi:MAG: hypothetical protein HQL32_04055 [Planctomycetes bacterium]|nr:hypothetical protein [Planctomycetota bacterium]
MKSNKVFPLLLDVVIEDIKHGTWQEAVDQIRAEANKEKRRELKVKRLPYFVPAGVFSVRNKHNLEKSSGAVTMDIDDISIKVAERIKKAESKKPETLAAFISPSGGLKLLIMVTPNDLTSESYLERWEAVRLRFESEYDISVDASGKDPARACFVSYDPEVYYNPNAVPWSIPPKSLASGEVCVNAREINSIEVSENNLDRARKYLEKIPSVQGSNGSEGLMKAARTVVSGFALSPTDQESLLNQWSNTVAQPPWSKKEQFHALDNARKTPSDKAEGWLSRQSKTSINSNKPDSLRELKNNFNKDKLKEIILTEVVNMDPVDQDVWLSEAAAIPEVKDIGITTKSMRTMIKEATSTKNLKKTNKGEVVMKYDTPVRTAEHFLNKEIGPGNILFYSGDLYLYKKGVFSLITPDAFSAKAQKWLGKQKAYNKHGIIEPFAVETKKITEVRNALKNLILVPENESLTTNRWLNNRTDKMLNFKNGLLNINNHNLEPHTLEYFSTNQLEVDYDPNAECPIWKRCLSDWFGEDDHAKETIDSLRRLFRYYITGESDQQKGGLFVGKPRAGKGITTTILKAIIGKSNCASPSLSQLGENFGLSSLLGKTLAIVGDASLGKRSDAGAIVETLKKITGGDSVDINRKNREYISVELPTRFVITCNQVNDLPDSSGAFASRWIIVPFENSFLGEEDKNLINKLITELAGIVRWSLEAKAQLFESRGGKACRAALEELTSPLAVFIREECVVGKEKSINTHELYDMFKDWCIAHEIEVVTKTKLSKDLKSTHRVTVKASNGQRRYLGIGQGREG